MGTPADTPTRVTALRQVAIEKQPWRRNPPVTVIRLISQQTENNASLLQFQRYAVFTLKQ